MHEIVTTNEPYQGKSSKDPEYQSSQHAHDDHIKRIT
jgi:hypothetical protein